jgi:hypothetical protein
MFFINTETRSFGQEKSQILVTSKVFRVFIENSHYSRWMRQGKQCVSWVLLSDLYCWHIKLVLLQCFLVYGSPLCDQNRPESDKGNINLCPTDIYIYQHNCGFDGSYKRSVRSICTRFMFLNTKSRWFEIHLRYERSVTKLYLQFIVDRAKDVS